MGSADKTAEKRAGRRASRRTAKKADWDAVPDAVLGRFVKAMQGDGRAVRIGYTRDGGGYAVGIYGDGDPYTEYIRPQEDVVEALEDICLEATGVDPLLRALID